MKYKFIKVTLLVIYFIFQVLQINATAITTSSWIGVSTDWSTASNWTGGKVPDQYTRVIIGDANFLGTSQPILQGDGSMVYCYSLEVRGDLKNSHLTITKGNGNGLGLKLSIAQDLVIGTGGKLELIGASLEVWGNFYNDDSYVETEFTKGATVTRPFVELKGANKRIGGTSVTTFSQIRIFGSISLEQNVIIKPFAAGTTDNPRGLTVKRSATLDPQLKKVSWQSVSTDAVDFVVEPNATIKVKAETFNLNYAREPSLMYVNSTVDYAAPNGEQTVFSRQYGILRISGGGVKKLEAAAQISSLDTVTKLLVEGGILDLKAFTLDRGGSSFVTGGTLKVSSGATIRVGNTTDPVNPRSNFPRDFNKVILHANSITEYYGADQLVATVNYGNLHISGSSGTKSLEANTSIQNEVRVVSSTLDILSFTLNRTAAGGVFNVENSAMLKLSGANTFPASYATYDLKPSSTVDYYGAEQTIASGLNYGNLSFTGSGTKTFAAGTTGIANMFTINSGVTADATSNSSTVNYNGTEAQSVAPIDYYNLTLTNDGIKTFTNTTGVQAAFTSTTTPSRANLTSTETTIDFNGSGPQTIPALWYSKVLVSQGGDKTLAGNIYIKRGLELASGRINTNGAKVTLGPAATILESENNYVTGTVETKRLLLASSNNFGGIGITITPKVEADSTKITRVTGTQAATNNKSILRHYIVEPTANQGSFEADLVFSYFDHELNGLTEAELLGFYSELFWADTEWMTYWNTTQASALNQVTLSNLRSLGRYTLGNGSPNPMPVELTSFKATKRGTDAELYWTVAREENNKGFEIQASTDGYTFQKISFVNSKVGTSNSKQEYSFTDNRSNKQGTIYYRLKQVDLDGEFTIYAPKDVKFSIAAGTLVSTYPNPFYKVFKAQLEVSQPVIAIFKLYSTTGKLILVREEQLQGGKNDIEFDTNAQLSKGMYILSAEVGNEVHKLKLMKQ